jgi:preprotein translocase subunit YajC
MLSNLEVGDEVVTAGGILGKVTKIGDQFLEVTLNDSMKVKVQTSAISNVLPKGTINSI